MALLKYKDIEKMNDKERKEKLINLKLELAKANVTANKTNAKTKEIKKAISRLLMFNTFKKKELKTK